MKYRTQVDKVVVGREDRNEPIMITLTPADKAEIAKFPPEGLSTLTIFPGGMSNAEKEEFLDDCEADPYLPLGEKERLAALRKTKVR